MKTGHTFGSGWAKIVWGFILISLIVVSMASVSASCYQESATVSNQSGTDGNCGLNYTGAYDTTDLNSNTNDGNYATSDSTNDDIFWYVNYTKPVATAVWQIKNGVGTFNYSIPSSCLASSILQLRIRLSAPPSPSGLHMEKYCWDGSWNLISSANPSGVLYEEGIFWFNDTTISNGTIFVEALNGTTSNWSENANLTFTSNQPTTSWFSWLVDGVEKLGGLAQNVFNWVFNLPATAPNATVTLLTNETNTTDTYYINTNSVNPFVSIVYPVNGANYVQDTAITQMNYSLTEINPDVCKYSLNGASNQTITCGQNVTGLTIPDGSNTITLYVNDTVGNTNSSTTTFNLSQPTAYNTSNVIYQCGKIASAGTYTMNQSIAGTNCLNVTTSGVNLLFNNANGNITFPLTSGTIYGNISLVSGLTSGNIQILNGSVYINSTANPTLNIPANITMNKPVTHFANPYVMKDNIVCTTCGFNSSELNNATVEFGVIGFSNYTIGFLPRIEINAPINLSYAYSGMNTTLNYSVENASLMSACWHTYYGGNQTFINCTSGIANLTLGTTKSITILVNDTYNNIASQTQQFEYLSWENNRTYTATVPETSNSNFTLQVYTPVAITLTNPKLNYDGVNSTAVATPLYSNTTGFIGTCYQETANVSTTCGGLGTGNYSYNTTTANSTWFDGDWNTYISLPNGNPAVYVNYSIPPSVGTVNFTWKTNSLTNNTVQVPASCLVSSNLQIKIVYDIWNGGSFSQGKVSMADGTFKEIKDVQVGDYVISHDEQTNTNVVSRVSDLEKYKMLDGDYIEIINNRLYSTPNHRVWINGEYSQILNIKIGDTLVDENGNSVIVTSLEKDFTPRYVYALEIENTHTYYVDGIKVHNGFTTQSVSSGLRATCFDGSSWVEITKNQDSSLYEEAVTWSGVTTNIYTITNSQYSGLAGNNKPFYWTYELSSGDKVQTTTNYQNVTSLTNINVTSGTCSAGLSPAFYFDFANELNRTAMSNSLTYNVQYGVSNTTAKVTSGTLSSVPNFTICINATESTYTVGYGEIQYGTSGFVNRHFYIFSNTRATNNTINNTLHDLNTADATAFQFTLTDTSLNLLSNYYLGLLRWYPEINEYKIVEMGKTDSNGQTAFQVKTIDVDYRIAVYQTDGTLIQLFDPIRLVCATSPCTYAISLTTDSANLVNFLNIQSNLSYDSANNRFVYIWNDPSQTTTLMNLTVYKDTGFSTTQICTSSATAFTGLLTCAIGTTTGHLRAEVYRSGSPPIQIASLLQDIGTSITTLVGGKTIALLMTFILFITLFLIGAFVSPILAMIFGVISLIPLMILGGISFGAVAGIGLIFGIAWHFMKNS